MSMNSAFPSSTDPIAFPIESTAMTQSFSPSADPTVTRVYYIANPTINPSQPRTVRPSVLPTNDSIAGIHVLCNQ